MDLTPLLLEGLKFVATGFIGFIAGRLQSKHGDHISRAKDQQAKLVDLVRALSKDAIEYHSRPLTSDERFSQCALLKNNFKRVTTDMSVLFETCKKPSKFCLDEYLAFFESVTTYPFEPKEIHAVAKPARLDEISESAETLVRRISGCKAPTFW